MENCLKITLINPKNWQQIVCRYLRRRGARNRQAALFSPHLLARRMQKAQKSAGTDRRRLSRQRDARPVRTSFSKTDTRRCRWRSDGAGSELVSRKNRLGQCHRGQSRRGQFRLGQSRRGQRRWSCCELSAWNGLNGCAATLHPPSHRPPPSRLCREGWYVRNSPHRT